MHYPLVVVPESATVLVTVGVMSVETDLPCGYRQFVRVLVDKSVPEITIKLVSGKVFKYQLVDDPSNVSNPYLATDLEDCTVVRLQFPRCMALGN